MMFPVHFSTIAPSRFRSEAGRNAVESRSRNGSPHRCFLRISGRILLLGLFFGGSLFGTLGIALTPVVADVTLPPVFSEHMVLQRDAVLPVWGHAEPGESVEVQLDRQVKKTTADAQGKWQVAFDPMSAGGPYRFAVKAKNSVVFQDVLIGEVWLCSGQSNMQWPLRQAEGSKSAIAKADRPTIRLLNYRPTLALDNRPFRKEESARCVPDQYFQGTWKVCSPETAADFSAVGYFFGGELSDHLQVPIGLMNNAVGGSPVEAWIDRTVMENDRQGRTFLERWPSADLLEPWVYQRIVTNLKLQEKSPGAEKVPGGPWRHPFQPGFLYEAGIRPIKPFAFRGVLWYQGESNAHDAPRYERWFPAMVEQWRTDWGQGDFPFLYVQLANMNRETWPEFREAQRHCLSIPNSGMAVTIDIGHPTDVHPRNKFEVGRRLSLLARKNVYGEKIVASGPTFAELRPDGNRLALRFSSVGGGLTTANDQPLTGFEIAGPDGSFVPAQAELSGDTLFVSSPSVSNPVSVRYAWASNPVANFVNREKLPASPFRASIAKPVPETAEIHHP